MTDINTTTADTLSFFQLGLPDSLIEAITAMGYTTPTPIQAQAIPALMSGSDVLGQAQTGTGKTAAFALPLLAKINVKLRQTQILVLTPTRELALQVAEAFMSFAANMPELNVLPIYGGQGYDTQLRSLRKGAHIVIGTPGRVMDHMRRNTLKLDDLKTLILDEADEMLRMGFADDVEWILEQFPSKPQTGLFSATMPNAIKSIADRYLDKPQKITVQATAASSSKIKQYFWQVSNINKLDALSRILETEESDAIIIFVKTKRATEELSEQLHGRGFNAVAINGDIVQKQRERVIDQLKDGRTKILVATDVAARGIDVDRVTHVINYDPPHNAESYVHRIGRTGRAGRTGTAIIFISPRDKYMLRDIERTTKTEMEMFEAPSAKVVNERRMASFKQRITEALTRDNSLFAKIIQEYVTETEAEPMAVAAALATLLQGNNDFLLKKTDVNITAKSSDSRRSDRSDRPERSGRDSGRERSSRFGDRERSSDRSERPRFGADRNERSSDRSERPRFGADRNERSSDRSERPRFGADRNGSSDRSERPRFGSSDRSSSERPRFGADRNGSSDRSERPRFGADRNERSSDRSERPRFDSDRPARSRGRDTDMEQYRVDIGADDGLQPRNLVGAIANTAGIEGRNIGRITIESKFALVDLPKGMASDALSSLKRLKISGKEMNLRKNSN